MEPEDAAAHVEHEGLTPTVGVTLHHRPGNVYQIHKNIWSLYFRDGNAAEPQRRAPRADEVAVAVDVCEAAELGARRVALVAVPPHLEALRRRRQVRRELRVGVLDGERCYAQRLVRGVAAMGDRRVHLIRARAQPRSQPIGVGSRSMADVPGANLDCQTADATSHRPTLAQASFPLRAHMRFA